MIGICYSKELIDFSNLLEIHQNRSIYLYSLIHSYNLFQKLNLIHPLKAKKNQLLLYHTKDYLKHLKFEIINKDYGLIDDSLPFKNVYLYSKWIAGSTISCCNHFIEKDYKIILDFEGGRHHALKDKASGYCFINDIILGIMILLKKFQKIFYIDLDVHHGDAIEKAFYLSDRVFTLSFHMYGKGIFPGTGDLDSIGKSKGKGFNRNVPLNSGIDDESFFYLFSNIISKIDSKFNSDIIILLCGADSLYNDPLGNFNLSSKGYLKCLDFIKSFNKKLLILGGGGYNVMNTVMLYTMITANILNISLNNDIPEHDYFHLYKNSNFELNIPNSIHMKNENSKEYIEKLINF